MAIIPYVQATLTANGAATGILTMASTTGFVAGAKVWLWSASVEGVELIIDEVVDATHLAVRLATKQSRYSSATLYTTAQTAKVTQNRQNDNAPSWRT